MDLVIFTEEILNGKLHFLCSDIRMMRKIQFCSSVNIFINGLFTLEEKLQTFRPRPYIKRVNSLFFY